MSGVAWMIRQGQVETAARYAFAYPTVQYFAVNGGCSATQVLPRFRPLGAAMRIFRAMTYLISWPRRRSLEDRHAKHTSFCRITLLVLRIKSCPAPYTYRRSSAYCFCYCDCDCDC